MIFVIYFSLDNLIPPLINVQKRCSGCIGIIYHTLLNRRVFGRGIDFILKKFSTVLLYPSNFRRFISDINNDGLIFMGFSWYDHYEEIPDNPDCKTVTSGQYFFNGDFLYYGFRILLRASLLFISEPGPAFRLSPKFSLYVAARKTSIAGFREHF